MSDPITDPPCTIRVLFLNNRGEGFADFVDVEAGTSIGRFIHRHLPEHEPGDLLIRVNRHPVHRDHVLLAGDRVSATATKIDGAATFRNTRGGEHRVGPQRR